MVERKPIIRTPVITGAKKPFLLRTGKWPVVLTLEVDTETGPLIFQATVDGILQLKARFEEMPPGLTPPNDD